MGVDASLFSGSRALITGGLGFIGSNLAQTLLQLGAEVTLIDSLIPEYGGNSFNVDGFSDQLNINISDVRDTHSMQHLVSSADYLFNLAGQTSHMDSMADPFTDLDINCTAQLSILETCRIHNPKIRIVFASTRQIYGKPDYLPVDEEHLVRPVDVNGINKAAGEWYHILYNNVYDIHSSALRLTNTYGPRMRVKDARQTFVGLWIRQILEGQPIQVWGGEQLRDFNYVDDVIDAMLKVATDNNSGGQIYNLGGDQVVSLRELAETLVTIQGSGDYEVKEFPKDRKKIDIGDYYSDWEKINKGTGWRPRVSLAEGLEKTLDYYKINLPKYI